MGILKMAKQKKENRNNIESKYIIFVIIAAAISYISYYFKFPNSFGAVLMAVFSALLLKNFSSIKGINLLVYFSIFGLFVLPLNIYSLNLTVFYRILFFIINAAILLLVISSLMNLRRWGFYLSLIFFLISSLSLSQLIFLVLKNFFLELAFLIRSANLALSLLFNLLAIAYIIKSRSYFR